MSPSPFDYDAKAPHVELFRKACGDEKLRAYAAVIGPIDPERFDLERNRR